MERMLAELIASNFAGEDGSKLNIFEVMAMTEIVSNGDKHTYALQKDGVIFLAEGACNGNFAHVTTKKVKLYESMED